MVNCVQVLDDVGRERLNSGWGRTFLPVGHQLVSQMKVDLSHAVVSGVVVPHIYEYLANGAELFLDQSIFGGVPLHGQKYGMYALGKKYGGNG